MRGVCYGIRSGDGEEEEKEGEAERRRGREIGGVGSVACSYISPLISGEQGEGGL